MRPFVVVAIEEMVELRLLLQEVLRRRPGGFFLQRQMHALVAAILLGMTGLDTLDVDAESQPPNGQFAQAVQRVRAGEWHAVVGADGFGQAEFFEHALEHAEGVDLLRRG